MTDDSFYPQFLVISYLEVAMVAFAPHMKLFKGLFLSKFYIVINTLEANDVHKP